MSFGRNLKIASHDSLMNLAAEKKIQFILAQECDVEKVNLHIHCNDGNP